MKTGGRLSRSATSRGVLAGILALALCVGCVSLGSGPKSQTGSLVGAAAGGLLSDGSFTGMVGGMLLGSLVGSAIGDYLDQRDQEIALKSAQYSLEATRSGQTTTWQNPDTGNSGTFTPVRTYQGGGGRYCREYQATVSVGGELQKAFGTACRGPDGSWEVVS